MTDKWQRALTLHLMDQEDAVNPTIAEQFNAFNDTNPVVFYELVQLADELLLHGYTRGSMKMLFEVLRWERMLATDDPSSEFKLNNNYTSHYARMVVQKLPRFEGFFETRNLRSA